MPHPAAARALKSPFSSHPFAALMVANFCFFMGFATFFLLPKYLITELGAAEREVGLLMAGYGVSMIACLPWVGVGSDRHGRRPYLLLGAGLLALTALAFVFIRALDALPYALRGLQGIAFACWFVNSSTLAVDLVEPARRGSALGLFGVSTLVTYGAAPALAEWIAGISGFTPVFALATGWCILAGLLSLQVPVPPRAATSNRAARSWLRLVTRPVIGRIGLNALLMGLAFGTVLVFCQPQALAKGIAPVSILPLSFALTSIVIRLGFSRLVDGRGQRTVLFFSLIAMALGTGALAGVEGRAAYALCGALVGMGHSLAYPTLNVSLINRLPAHEHGTGMSLFVAAFNVGTILAQFGFGLLIPHLGLSPVFLLAAAAVLLALPLVPGITARRPALDQ